MPKIFHNKTTFRSNFLKYLSVSNCITQMRRCPVRAENSKDSKFGNNWKKGVVYSIYYHEAIICAVLVFCALTDVTAYRIPNKAILVGLAAGLFGAASVPGFLGRFMLAAALAFLAYAFGMVGGGDVKVMSLIAAWLGLADGAAAIGIGLCLGAVLALVKMLRHGSMVRRFQYVILYIRNIIQKKEISLYYVEARDGRDCVIPLGACLCAGALMVAVWRST